MKPNGRDQVAAMRKLINSEQRAPASDWKPDTLAGFRVGDAVRLPNLQCTFEVIGLADPLLVLRAPSGHELKAGWQAVQRVQAKVRNV